MQQEVHQCFWNITVSKFMCNGMESKNCGGLDRTRRFGVHIQRCNCICSRSLVQIGTPYAIQLVCTTIG